MIVLLSPAKSLDYSSPLATKRATQPRFKKEALSLIDQLKILTEQDIGQLMSISEKLSALNHERFQTFESDFTPENSRAAILAFTGDVYQGIDTAAWSADDFSSAQNQIRILSGLYGLLRPLDLIQPYRLEMGTRFANASGKNLYEFWGEKITDRINQDLSSSGSDIVVNLASNEYFSSVKKKTLAGTLVTPVFKDEKNGTFKIISFYAKKARGMMADFIIREQINSTEALKGFQTAGYAFSPQDSTDSELVFYRKEQ